MYAVVKTGGKQIKVEEGTEAVVEKLNVAVGGSVDFEVLYYSDGDDRIADPGLLSDAKVTAEVLEHFKGDKVVVFKFKKRKGYKRTKGHRQQLTKVRVTGIAAPKGGKKVAAKPKAAPKTAAAKPKTKVESAQCEAVKANGERCANKAKPGSKYCGVHAKKD